MSGAGPHGPLVFGLEDPPPAGGLTGLTSADGSVKILAPGGPVPDLSVLKVYGGAFLGIAAMGNIPTGVWFQVPLPTALPLQNVAKLGSDLVPAESADYAIAWGAAAEYIADPANSVLRFVATLNGAPGGGGTPIDGTEAIWELNPTKRVLTMSRSTIFPVAAGDALGLYLFADSGPPMPATSINLNLTLGLA